MTTQAREQIIYKNEKYEMTEEPLEQYLSTMIEEPVFYAQASNCWRGYYGTWKLKGEKLYLIDLIASGEDGKQTGIEDLFPGKKEVFAEWFCGEIKVPQGELIEYIHFGHESVHEEELILDFQDGVLMDSYSSTNNF